MKIPEGFVPHSAGPNPVPGKSVRVIYPDGAISLACSSEFFESMEAKNYWQHERGGKFDIAAYRVVQPPVTVEE